MKIEVRQTKSDGIVQITTLDERWYQKGDKYVPSVTWVAGHYPKGVAFYKWLANKGWDEAEAIKSSAGDKGSKVHRAIEELMSGATLKMDAKYSDGNGQESELSVEEWECIMSFADWFKETKPKILQLEQVVFNDQMNYAGTVDMVCEINGKKFIVDIKTSQSIWPEYELQVSAYKHAMTGIEGLAILQVGYRLNKRKWKFNEVEDKFDLFQSAYKIWLNENENVSPKQREYPVELALNLNANITGNTKESEHNSEVKVGNKRAKGSAGNRPSPSKVNSRQGSNGKRSGNGKAERRSSVLGRGKRPEAVLPSGEAW